MLVVFLVTEAVRISVGSATVSMIMAIGIMETFVGLVGIAGATIVWFIVS